MDRFSGFADLYDSNRPAPPAALGPLLARYANTDHPVVVDLGSGTGLSSRWAAGWARSVVGIEPNADMRGQADARPCDGVEYRRGTSSATGLADGCADVVLAVQAMHWMEPTATLAEVARLLKPGGVFAAVDADWPPVSGVVDAESAWEALHRRIRIFEARASREEPLLDLRRPVDDDDPALVGDDLSDPHRNRAMPGGVQSWSKAEHLDRIRASGHFRFARELAFDQPTDDGGAVRFVALMRSQGSYQSLRKLGMTDEDLGADAFETAVRAAFAASPGVHVISFTWRVRLGVTPR